MIESLLKKLKDEKGSDLHILTNSPAHIRIDGNLIPFGSPITSTAIKTIVKDVLLQDQSKFNKFLEEKELDFSFSTNFGRFRTNISIEKGSISIVFRYISENAPSLDDLKSPKILKEIISNNKGLILVTGPTGTGKTTTIAALINEINENESKKIITIEDPIEYIHKPKKSIIAQRAVGVDTHSFEEGLRRVLRQDPDVILVGEIRDKMSAEIALKAASTGHLVLSTLHTNSASETIGRIVDLFHHEEAQKVRELLSSTIISIISQELIPKIDGGRIAVEEILYNNIDIARLIRENKLNEIYSYMQSSLTHKGFTQTQRLKELIHNFDITHDMGLKFAHHKDEFKRMDF